MFSPLSRIRSRPGSESVGLVNTMVFTHIPSSICLILAAFSPNLTIVLGLLLVRSALSQMDVPTRTSYVTAVVTPAERTAAASVTAVPRSLASAISPALSGALLSTSFAALSEGEHHPRFLQSRKWNACGRRERVPHGAYRV